VLPDPPPPASDTLFWLRYIASYDDLMRYIASHPDLIPQLRTQATKGEAHYYNTGQYESRSVTFDSLAYLRAHPEVQAVCGTTDQTCATRYWSSPGLMDSYGVAVMSAWRAILSNSLGDL
jgi:hypothetical protein